MMIKQKSFYCWTPEQNDVIIDPYLFVPGWGQSGPLLPPEISTGNAWKIHSDERVGTVVAHVKVREAQRGEVVLSIQKSAGHYSPLGGANPFGEDGSSYFRVVNRGQGGVVRLAKSLKNFKVNFKNGMFMFLCSLLMFLM